MEHILTSEQDLWILFGMPVFKLVNCHTEERKPVRAMVVEPLAKKHLEELNKTVFINPNEAMLRLMTDSLP